MAAGVAVVTQNDWGWREMIEHGVTGFLGGCDEELAHYTAMLAYDEAPANAIGATPLANGWSTNWQAPMYCGLVGSSLFESVESGRRAAA